MLLRGEDQVTGYHRHFQSLLARCYSLIQYTADPVEILESYDLCTDENGFYMVMDQPCFGRFYADEVIGRYLRPGLPFYDRLAAAARRRFGRLRTAERFYTLFTRGGLERFRDTGALDDFPTSFVAPFPPEQRRLLMAAMAERIRSGGHHRAADAAGPLPRLPEHDHLPALRRGLLHHRALFPFRTASAPLQIRESNLCRAFHQWLLHLPDSEAVLSGEETAAVLDELARTLT